MTHIRNIMLIALIAALALSILTMLSAFTTATPVAMAGGNEPDYVPCGALQSSYTCWESWQIDPTASQACPTNYYTNSRAALFPLSNNQFAYSGGTD